MEKKEFRFDEKKHRYYLDGKSMTGCTTVLGVIAKPALIQWAADHAAAYALCSVSPFFKGRLIPGIINVSNALNI